MYKVYSSNLNSFFEAINDEMALYLPIEVNGLVEFSPWVPGATVRLDMLNTVRSPKDFFFPHIESIAEFRLQKKEITISSAQTTIEPFAIFGVRGCDAASLNLLDRVFLSEPIDTFYGARRESGIIITSACFQPEESCFCTVFDIDATNPIGDISTWFVGDTLYWQSLTERGDKLTEKVEGLLQSVDDSDKALIAEHKAKAKDVFAKLPFSNLSLETFKSNPLMEKFNSKEWEELYVTCLGCGTCTFICPTCHCYDIQDVSVCDKVSRSRCWDSCMYSDFTLMAHGNSRNSQLERFRQRFMHKLVYFPDNNDGKFACTGCGRCVKKCPVSLNIVKVAKALEGDENV